MLFYYAVIRTAHQFQDLDKAKPGVSCGIHEVGLKQIPAVVDAALGAGYRHFDCAAAFRTEKEIGRALAEGLKKHKLAREDIFVSSKHSSKDFPMDSSGKKLAVDDVPNSVTWEAMESLVGDKLVRSIGLSNFNRKQITSIVDSCKIKPANLQVEVNANFPNTKLTDWATSQGISVTASSPLGSPDFSGKMFKIKSLLDEPWVGAIADKHKKMPAQILLRYLVQRGFAVIPKSVKPERIQENAKIFDFELTPSEMNELNSKGSQKRAINFAIMESHPEYPFRDEY